MKKEDIVEIINGYAYKEDNETPKIIEERDFENIAEELVKLFAIPVVKARILDDLKTKAKEADAEADRIGAADREGGFEKSGEAVGLEIAIEVVGQYVP